MSMRTPLTSAGLMAVGLLLTRPGDARRAATTGGRPAATTTPQPARLRGGRDSGHPHRSTRRSRVGRRSVLGGTRWRPVRVPVGQRAGQVSHRQATLARHLGRGRHRPGDHREGHDVQGGRARTDSGTPPPPHQRQDARRDHVHPGHPPTGARTSRHEPCRRRHGGWRTGGASHAGRDGLPVRCRYACASPSRTTRPTSRGLTARRWRCRKRNRPRPATLARMYSDGQLRVVEDTSESFTRVLFARPGFRPRACTPAR